MRALTSWPVTAVTVSLCLLAPSRPANADDVRFQTTDPGLELWNQTPDVAMVPVRVGRFGTRMTRSYVYSPLCPATPCTASMALGTHVLGLSQPGGPIVEAESAVSIGGQSTITATYHDRSIVRALGWATLLGGTLGGAALFFSAAQTSGNPPEPTLNPTLAGLGVGLFVGGLIGGVALAVQHDSATFMVTPVLALGPGAKRETDGASAAMNGLALTVRF